MIEQEWTLQPHVKIGSVNGQWKKLQALAERLGVEPLENGCYDVIDLFNAVLDRLDERIKMTPKEVIAGFLSRTLNQPDGPGIQATAAVLIKLLAESGYVIAQLQEETNDD